MAFSTTKRVVETLPGLKDVRWTLTETSGSSEGEALYDCDSITVQLIANGTVGTVRLRGSNNGNAYFDLPTPVELTASGIKSVPADGLGFVYYRVELSGGDGTTNHTVRVAGVKRTFARA